MSKFEELAADLECVSNGQVLVNTSKDGICGNFQRLYPEEWAVLEETGLLIKAFKSWEYFSGDDIFPVPSLCHKTPATKYIFSGNKWTGAYGELRKKLCFRLSEFITSHLDDLTNHYQSFYGAKL